MPNATLRVDLNALRSNYQLLQNKHAKKNIAAVVKANAYGLGVEQVSKTLSESGCQNFFVATLEEAVQLRSFLPNAAIYVFNGVFAGEEKEFLHHNIIPVLNSREQMEHWRGKNQAALHIDTGMTRLGLTQSELEACDLSRFRIALVMSHLACANDPSHPKNIEQLTRFKEALGQFKTPVAASLANSAGIFLSPDYHYDIGRPGCALYGIDRRNLLQHVATLSAPILQIRNLDRDETVGYGATRDASKGSRLAIIGMGYADGYFRLLGNKGIAYIAGRAVPIVGRISMDMITLDVSDIPESELSANARAEFINETQTVDAIAQQCDTIGYEIFTRIGRRVERVYS